MSYTFCPKCGGRLRKKYIDKNKELVCKNCHFIFYQNSKPTASALIIKGDKILLAQRAIEPYKNFWDVPGGFLKLKEHPEQGLAREIKEELNVDIKIKKLLGIFMDKYGASGDCTLNIYYLAEIKKGKLKPASDVKSFKWFEIDNLPKDVAFKASKDALRALKKLR